MAISTANWAERIVTAITVGGLLVGATAAWVNLANGQQAIIQSMEVHMRQDWSLVDQTIFCHQLGVANHDLTVPTVADVLAVSRVSN